jgi:hypothetical protein
MGAANTPSTAPIFTRQAEVSSNSGAFGAAAFAAIVLTATADFTGVSANHQEVFRADENNGGFIQRIRFKAIGTNVATVARIYINNGGVQTVAVNNVFYGEQSLPATTLINTAATLDIDYPMNIALNPGFRIWVGLGTTVAAGWRCTAIGGRY